MMAVMTPVLAHDPEFLFGLVAGVLFMFCFLHAAWYWFVHQVGFMLAAIGTKVERWCKVALPLVLIPVSCIMTVCVPLLLVLPMQDEDESLSVLWAVASFLLLVALVLGVPFVLGYYMLRFSLKQSLGSAFFMALVYTMMVLSVGQAFRTAWSSHLETTVEVTEIQN